jgi:DNA-binding transcriptional LysR family regulator
MDFNTLKIFRSVARAGSISRAAEELHYVQSNVSARIQQLEERLGATLFVRQSRGMRLTAAGETLISYADRILNMREEAIQAVLSTTQGKGLLKIGVMESTLAIRLPDVLHDFVARYPDINLDIQTGATDTLLDAVVNHRVDGAFIGGDIKSSQVKSVYLLSEEIVLITSTSMTSPDQCAFKKLIVFRQGCAYRAFGEQWLREQGYSPVKITELGTLDGILTCVSAGIGITFLPKSVAEKHFLGQKIRFHSLDSDRARVNINVIMNGDTQPHPGLMMLVDLIL